MEVRMSDTELRSSGASDAAGPTAVPLRFEVTVLPVADDDRAKAFYQRLGWRLDADFPIDEHFRVIQFTPPGSPASIQFGKGTTQAAPGSVEGLYLIVDDLDAAREELIRGGAEVSDVWHGRGLGAEGHVPGPDPDSQSYRSFASFADPDGNTWLLQEIKQRLPGRVEPMEVGDRAELLHETALRHGSFEAVAPPHDWWDWYSAYMGAREGGSTPDEASEAAGRYMAEVKNIVVSPA
jgi:catechol 2,3-dioxygenase-like lactoylglutathione lyase family enzyme